MHRVSIFMDVEDPINPCADDAAREIASVFTGLGIRGSFCLTGDKCRSLLRRERRDVLEAFHPHCLGLHTDTHSIHPTTMELLSDVSYDEGCKLALISESRGVEAFRSAFDRKPAFWGGAGNTWSPEIAFALNNLGIPAYAYALTSLPNFAVHKFNRVFALPQAFSISEGDWADDRRATECSDNIFQSLSFLRAPWVGIFVGHPTRFRHTQFWDVPYTAGRTTASPEEAPLIEEETYQRSVDNLCRFLDNLRQRFQIVGVDEVFKMEWQFRSPSIEELEYFRQETTNAIRNAARWPIHHPNLDPENIINKTLRLAKTLEVGDLSDQL